MKVESLNSSFLKCLEYILKKYRFKCSIQNNRYIFNKLVKMESPYSILDELNIKYQKVNCLSSGYNIKIENNIAKVICIDNDDLIDGTNGYSDEVIKDKNDTFIIIESIPNDCIKLLSKRNYIIYSIKQFQYDLINLLKIFIIALINDISIFIIGAMFENIIDNLIPYRNIRMIFISILIVFSFCILFLINTDIKKRLFNKRAKRSNESCYKIVNLITTVLIIIPIYFYNLEMFKYMLFSVSVILICDYVLFLLNCNIKSNFYEFFYVLLVTFSILMMFFMNVAIYINNGINRGSILSNLLIYSYIIYTAVDAYDLFEIVIINCIKLYNDFYIKQLNELKEPSIINEINDIFIQDNNKKKIYLKKGSLNVIHSFQTSNKKNAFELFRYLKRYSNLEIFFNKINCLNIKKVSINEKCAVIGNNYFDKALEVYDYLIEQNNIDEKSLEIILKEINLYECSKNNLIKGKEYFTDFEAILLLISYYIITNKKVIIFDNILSKFDSHTLYLIDKVLKDQEIYGISFECNCLNDYFPSTLL